MNGKNTQTQSSRPDKIPAKFGTMTADIIGAYLTNISNGLFNNSFSDSSKLTAVRLIFKVKEERSEMENSRRAGILNCLSKIHE